MPKDKKLCPNTKLCHIYIPKFDLKVKDLRHIEIMNVRDTSFHRDRPMCKIWYATVKANKVTGRTQNMSKTYKFDLEVKGQRRLGIMN